MSVRTLRNTKGRPIYQGIPSGIKDADGKRRQPSRCFKRRKDAEAWVAEMERKSGRGIGDPAKQTVPEYLDYWVDNHPKDLSPSTRVGYKRNIEMIKRYLGHLLLTELTARHIDSMVKQAAASGGRSKDGKGEDRPLSPRSCQQMFNILRTAMRQAVRWQLIEHSPANNATPPKVPRAKVRGYVDDEWPRIQTAAAAARHPHMSAIVSTLAITGMRRSEVLGLKWDCVDLERGTVEVRRTLIVGENGEAVLRDSTKSEGSARTISIPPSLIQILSRHRAFVTEHALAYGPDHHPRPWFVFGEPGGSPMKPASLTSKMRSLMRSAGVRGMQPCHALRHSMASGALASGVDIATISARLGHSKISTTTDLYLHTDDTRDRAAAATIAKALGL